MRTFFFSAISSLLFFSCQTDTSNQMIVKGTVKELKRGTVYLQKWNDSVLTVIDSVVLEGKSDFKFNYPLTEPEIFYVSLNIINPTDLDDEIYFFGEPGVVKIQTHLDGFGSKAMVSGSVNDSIWRVYDKIKQRYIARNLELIEKKLSTNLDNNDSLRNAFERQEQSLANSKHMATVNFALSHSDYEIAPFIVLDEAYNVRAKYLDTVYQSLAPKIKTSKYGTVLEQLIESRKEMESELFSEE